MNYKEYDRALNACSDMAVRELESVINKLDTSKKKSTRDVLLLVVPALVEKYGDMAAGIAAEYYEQKRAEQISGHYRATTADGEPLDNIQESVRYACGHLFTKDNDGR